MTQFTAQAPAATFAARESRPDGEPLLMLDGGPGVPDWKLTQREAFRTTRHLNTRGRECFYGTCSSWPS